MSNIMTPEKRVMNYFYRHVSELKDDMRNHFEKGEPLSFPSGIIVNEWPGKHTIVEYIVKARGIVPSSKYYGFFYSIDNVPVSFQNSGENLTRLSASEWEWRGEGDNRGYIRQIEPYWFYFEASL